MLLGDLTNIYRSTHFSESSLWRYTHDLIRQADVQKEKHLRQRSLFCLKPNWPNFEQCSDPTVALQDDTFQLLTSRYCMLGSRHSNRCSSLTEVRILFRPWQSDSAQSESINVSAPQTSRPAVTWEFLKSLIRRAAGKPENRWCAALIPPT